MLKRSGRGGIRFEEPGTGPGYARCATNARRRVGGGSRETKATHAKKTLQCATGSGTQRGVRATIRTDLHRDYPLAGALRFQRGSSRCSRTPRRKLTPKPDRPTAFSRARVGRVPWRPRSAG
jgi:hypothetical protein